MIFIYPKQTIRYESCSHGLFSSMDIMLSQYIYIFYFSYKQKQAENTAKTNKNKTIKQRKRKEVGEEQGIKGGLRSLKDTTITGGIASQCECFHFD